MKNSIVVGILLCLLTTHVIFSCPFIINNDTNTTILIVDSYNKQALCLNSGSTAEIDPSISGWYYYFYHEKLDIYVPQEDNPDLFYRRYQLTEKYCVAEKTKLTVSNIIQFTTLATDRLNTTEFKPPQYNTHMH